MRGIKSGAADIPDHLDHYNSLEHHLTLANSSNMDKECVVQYLAAYDQAAARASREVARGPAKRFQPSGDNHPRLYTCNYCNREGITAWQLRNSHRHSEKN